MSGKLNISFNIEKFEDFLLKMEDLSKIGDVIKIKIDTENIFMYSIVGETVLLALKSYLLKTDEYISFKEKDLEDISTIDIISINSKKLIKNLFFIKSSPKIQMELSYKKNDDKIQIRSAQFKGDKIKLAIQCGEESEIRDITKKTLSDRIDLKGRKWSFKVTSSKFQDIKKLASINSEGKILYINVDNNKILISENSIWELEIGEVEYSNKQVIFNKSFLSSIDSDSDDVEFNMFDSFILTKGTDSNLIISIETSFED